MPVNGKQREDRESYLGGGEQINSKVAPVRPASVPSTQAMAAGDNGTLSSNGTGSKWPAWVSATSQHTLEE